MKFFILIVLILSTQANLPGGGPPSGQNGPNSNGPPGGANAGAQTNYTGQELVKTRKKLKQQVCKIPDAIEEPVSVPINIEVHFNLWDFDVDESTEFLHTHMEIVQIWQNDAFKFDPSKFMDIDSIQCPITDIWTPDLYLVNSKGDPFKRLHELSNSRRNLIINSTGEVRLMDIYTFTSSCDLNLYHFPYDIQSCKLYFASWEYDEARMVLTSSNMKHSNTNLVPITSDFETNSIWTLKSITAETKSHNFSDNGLYSRLEVTVQIDRNSRLFVVNLIAPCVILSILSMMTFFLHEGTGEKIGFCITILLTVTVFQQFTISNLPRDELPYLAKFYFIVQVFNAITLILTTITLANYNSLDPPSKKLTKVIVYKLGPLLGVGPSKRNTDNQVVPMKSLAEEKVLPEDTKISDDEDEDMVMDELETRKAWSAINRVLNRFFFILVLVTVCICFVLIFIDFDA